MRWLKQRGWSYIEFDEEGLDAHPIDAWCIISGPSPRHTVKHACVGYGHVIKHDPHPSRDGLAEGPRTIGLFVARNPANTAGRMPGNLSGEVADGQ